MAKKKQRKKKPVWVWNEGCRLHGHDPQKIGDELIRLGKQHEIVTPEIVLERAKSTLSPLHECFEWSDKRAAHKWRLSQAMLVIRSVRVLPEKGEPQRVWVNLKTHEHGSAYHTVDDIRRVPDLRAQMLQTALRDLRAFERRFAELSELSGVFDEIQKFDDALIRLLEEQSA